MDIGQKFTVITDTSNILGTSINRTGYSYVGTVNNSRDLAGDCMVSWDAKLSN